MSESIPNIAARQPPILDPAIAFAGHLCHRKVFDPPPAIPILADWRIQVVITEFIRAAGALFADSKGMVS